MRASALIVTMVIGSGCATRSQKARALVEPDALVFVWGSATVAATAYFAADPAKQPRLFSADEGGNEPRGNTIPNWQVGVGAATVPLLIASTGDDARWYHTKGAVESLLTTAALTELSKNVFSRHRPEYDPASTNEDDRKSFFSGHSSLTLAAATYAGLYLHEHVFSQWRGDSTVAWWEIPPYLALATTAILVPYTRVEDNMHHRSDVLIGGVVGASLSTIFYLWQERRYQRDRSGVDKLAVVPLVDTPGAAVTIAFD